MIQLDNTTKGHKVETLSPQEQALNGQLGKLPVILELKEKDAEIIEDLESLKAGQTEIHEFVKEGFAKGKDRMDGMAGEMKEIKDDMKTLKDMFTSFVTQSQANHNEIKSEIQNGKIQELRNELQLRQKDDDKKSAFKTGLAIGLSVLGAGAILSILGYLFIKAYG